MNYREVRRTLWSLRTLRWLALLFLVVGFRRVDPLAYLAGRLFPPAGSLGVERINPS